MEPIVVIAIVAHTISAIVAFIAARYTYEYMRRSEKFFVVKDRTPFFTIGLIAFGIASILDIVALFMKINMSFSPGTLVRMMALVYMMGGTLSLHKMLSQE